MDPHLDKLQREIASAIAGLSPEQMNWHPPGKWCAAEVLEHLYLTYTGTVKGFERVAEAGKPLATAPSWKQRGRTLVVCGLGYLPSGREAPAVTRPRGVPAEKVLAEIGPVIARMDEVIRQCEEKIGRADKIAGPSDPRAADRIAMEEVSSSAWAASWEAVAAVEAG